MKQFLMMVLALMTTASAFASREDLRDILSLTEQVKIATRSTKASDADLAEAKQKLGEVLTLLNQMQTPAPTETGCFDFAHAKYYVSQSSAAATDNAIAACKKISDLEVAEFIYQKLYISLPSATAMDQAADLSEKLGRGKLDMLQFAYQKYYIVSSARDAITQAANQVATVRRGRLECLQTLFTKYNVTQSSATAMDSAAAGCK